MRLKRQYEMGLQLRNKKSKLNHRAAHLRLHGDTQRKKPRFRQHRTRPCTERKSGAPAVIWLSSVQGPGHLPFSTPIGCHLEDGLSDPEGRTAWVA